MKTTKKFLLTIVALAVLLTSNQTKAGIGAMAVAPVVVTTGLVVAGVGVAGTALGVAGVLTSGNDWTMALGGILLARLSMIVGLVGLVILDNEQSMSYSEISEEEGNKLGLTYEEIDSYNREIDQVNALASYVDGRMAELKKPKTEDAKKVWEEVADSVYPETFSAMQKITASMLAK